MLDKLIFIGGRTTWAAFAFLVIAHAPARGAELTVACKPVFAAMERTLQADHATSTTRGNDTIQGVTVGGVNYVQVGGAWHKSPMSVQDMLAQSRENLRNAKSLDCKSLPDSVIDGSGVANYATKTVGKDASGSATVAIDKRTGLVVRVDNRLAVDASHETHYVTQYRYGNIKAPM